MSKIRINTIHILLTALMLGATAAFAQEVIDDINFGWRFAKGAPLLSEVKNAEVSELLKQMAEVK